VNKENDNKTDGNLPISDVKRIFFKYGDKVRVGNKLGIFHRYGATTNTAIVFFHNDGLGFCNENSINYA